MRVPLPESSHPSWRFARAKFMFLLSRNILSTNSKGRKAFWLLIKANPFCRRNGFFLSFLCRNFLWRLSAFSSGFSCLFLALLAALFGSPGAQRFPRTFAGVSFMSGCRLLCGCRKLANNTVLDYAMRIFVIAGELFKASVGNTDQTSMFVTIPSGRSIVALGIS